MFRIVLALWLPLAACSALPSAHAGASPHAERISAAEAVYTELLAGHSAGMASLDDVCAWSVRWHHAQKEAGDLAAGKAHLARMEALSAQVEKAVASGMAPARDAGAMAYYVAEAKVWAQP